MPLAEVGLHGELADSGLRSYLYKGVVESGGEEEIEAIDHTRRRRRNPGSNAPPVTENDKTDGNHQNIVLSKEPGSADGDIAGKHCLPGAAEHERDPDREEEQSIRRVPRHDGKGVHVEDEHHEAERKTLPPCRSQARKARENPNPQPGDGCLLDPDEEAPEPDHIIAADG